MTGDTWTQELQDEFQAGIDRAWAESQTEGEQA